MASVAGQTTVGQRITSPWFDGSFEETQGWGPSPLGLEPEGHGYAHWHAGVDVGLPCGTTIKLPGQLQGVRCVWVDNPGGYGTALMLQLGLPVIAGRAGNVQTVKRVDVWLGHLRQRLVSDGQIVSGGTHLALSNNTGNSTGCHVHFEVRPGGGRYGTDIDPSDTLFGGAPGAQGPSGTTTTDGQNPYNPIDPRYEIWNAEHAVSQGLTALEAELVGLAQAALGTVILLGGVVVTIMALRGRSLPQIGQSVAGVVRGAARKRAQAGAEHERDVAAIRATGERESRRQLARESLDVRRQGREEAASAAGMRRNTIGAFRAGLISRAEAQRRLGEPVRATGRRARDVAYGGREGTFSLTGLRRYSRARDTRPKTVDIRRAALSRVRPSHQRAAARAIPKEPPFGGQIQ